jgi:predicted transcriptional regulator of viral defense system
MDNNIILMLYSRPETVFTVNEISQYFPTITSKRLKDRLYHAVKIGKLKRVRKGVYVKDKFNPLELASKIYTPSYISLETVLSSYGVIFQHYESISVVSYLTRTITVDINIIHLRRMFHHILVNPTGIELKDGYYVATCERAFLDAIYLYKNYHFDNVSSINWERVKEYSKIYNNAAFNRRVMSYYNDYLKEYVEH